MFSILLVGNHDRLEFRDGKSHLDRFGNVCEAKDIAAAEAMLLDGSFIPALIVLLQAYPGQCSHECVDRLRQLAPLARIVGLLGSWCEGETRTGSPWQGVTRTYWHQWPQRCRRELSQLVQGRVGAWSLPPTATEEERLLAGCRNITRRQQGLVVLHTRSRETAEWLADACAMRGLTTVQTAMERSAIAHGASLGIFEASDLGNEEFNAIRRCVRTIRPAPVLVLMSFPRVEDRQRAIDAGAAAVLSKPVAIDDLFSAMDDALASRQV